MSLDPRPTRSHPTAAQRVARTVAVSLVTVAALFAGCGDSTSVIGGDCRAPYIACDRTCVDPTSDSANCGACGVTCASGTPCVDGVCTSGIAEGGSADALLDRTLVDTGSGGDSALDGPSSDGLADGASDGSHGDGSSDGPASPDADGGPGSDGSSSLDGQSDSELPDSNVDACTPPYVTESHCGDCFTQCVAPNDACKLGDAGDYQCLPFCDAPLTHCGNACKDLQNDGDNCGICNRVCASNICINGVCQGTSSGDIVYVGHDYSATPIQTSQARLLQNAVLLAPKTPVRVLAYQRYASANAVARVTAILSDAQAQSGRTIQVTPTSTDAAVAAVKVANYEVVLVYDQLAAPTGTMATLGASWQTALTSFTHVGGVVIILDGDTGPNPEMDQFATATGLLSVTSHTSIPTGDQLEIASPTDAVALGVITPYAMRPATARFTSEAQGGPVSWVARHVASGDPTVIHKIAP